MLNVLPTIDELHTLAEAEREISLVGFLSSPSGLGAGARRNVVALTQAGFNVVKYNLALGHRFEMPVPDAAMGVPASSRTIFHINPPEILANSTAVRRVKKQSYVIGYWAWELPVMPAIWAGALDLVDEIWVPSRFVASAYGEATPKPINVIPHPIPLNDVPQSRARERFNIPLDRYVFLAAFDTESYPTRKNPWGAVRAFMEAFPEPDGSSPLLVLKLHGTSHRSVALARLLAEISAHPLIQVIDQSLNDEDILHLQAACDCFVSLHRSEGFGLNIAECMAAGRLAIATGFSGNCDFMRPGNSILIPYTMREVVRGDYVAGVGQWWAEPDHGASVKAMRWAFEHQDEARALGARGRADIAAGFSFEHVGALAAAALAREIPKRAASKLPGFAQAAASLRVGRNDPCPCGSGRKFKVCHGRPASDKTRR